MDPNNAPGQWGVIQAVPLRTMSERMNNPSFAGIVVCTLLIVVPLVGLVAFFVDVVMILRYVFGHRAPGSAQWSVHHPSVTSLIVVWVIALFTIVVYPLAFYMTWRFFVESQDRRRAGSKVCPRCAETIKAAALICRHCGQEFEAPAALPAEASIPVVGSGPGGGAWEAQGSGRSLPDLRGYGVLFGAVLAAVAVVGLISLTFLGGQVSRINGAASLPPCVLVLDGPAGRLEMWLHGATAAQCEVQLAAVRKSVGPDTSASRLYLTGVVPSGKPVCTKNLSEGVVDVFTSGSVAASLGSQVCESLSH
jgi:hypothetical protein